MDDMHVNKHSAEICMYTVCITYMLYAEAHFCLSAFCMYPLDLNGPVH